MGAHRLRGDVWVEGVVRIGQVGQLEGHRRAPFARVIRVEGGYAAAAHYRPTKKEPRMPKFEEIAPRELRPEVYELDGISRASVEAHYKLYQGYVNKRNEILAKLAAVDLSSANQVYSDLRALKVDLTFAIGGIKNHEIYFEHLGGGGGEPTG